MIALMIVLIIVVMTALMSALISALISAVATSDNYRLFARDRNTELGNNSRQRYSIPCESLTREIFRGSGPTEM
ncbi:hypothetical protein BDW67DRAFT_161413 [Aspergillus spinulosporus]